MLELAKSSTVRKIASNTLYQLIGKAITMAVTILITVIVARYYGRVSYGEFNLMQAFPALFFIIVDFGLNAIATREISLDWTKANSYFANILGIRIVFSAFLIVISGLLLFLFPYSSTLRFGIQIGLLLILSQALFATTNIIFQVNLRYDLSTIGLVSSYAAILGFSLMSAFFGWHVMWINFSYVIGGLISFMINLHFLKRFGIYFAIKFDKVLWKYLFIQSLPLGLMFIFSQINFRSDSILLSVLPLPEKVGLSGTESVAVYGLPYKIFEVSLVLPTFFMNSVYPIFVKHMNENEEKFKKTLFQSLQVLALAGVLVGVAGYFMAPWIIGFLGGEEFILSVTVLRVLLGGVIVFYLTQPISWLLITLEKQVYLPLIYLIGAVFNLGLNLVLIPRYSFYASANLTWTSEILILLLLVIYARKAWKAKYA